MNNQQSYGAGKPVSCPGCFFTSFPMMELKKKKDCCKKWKKEKRCKKCPAH